VPELPDLEAIRCFLNPRLAGRRIERAAVLIPVVVRVPAADFAGRLEGRRFLDGEPVTRLGKFLFFALDDDLRMVVNPMLAGRFQLVTPDTRRAAKTSFAITLADGQELRYADERVMGKVYLAPVSEVSKLPQMAELGPDVLDPQVTEEVFAKRLKRFPGQTKNGLINQRFLAGIGNAYADEILWEAGIHPYRRQSTLKPDEVARLYRAVHEVMDWATAIVTEKMSEGLDLVEWREHLRIHRRGGAPCPRCGNPITEITAGQRITNYCRHCQPMEDGASRALI
jgi:formamidopyrimidine-DNA glycosylase